MVRGAPKRGGQVLSSCGVKALSKVVDGNNAALSRASHGLGNAQHRCDRGSMAKQGQRSGPVLQVDRRSERSEQAGDRAAFRQESHDVAGRGLANRKLSSGMRQSASEICEQAS